MSAKYSETGRVLIYHWKLKDLSLLRSSHCSLMSEMVEFSGVKAFRFCLKRADVKQPSAVTISLINTSLHKVGLKVSKVSVAIKSKTRNGNDTEPVAADLIANPHRVDHLQLFTKDMKLQLPVDRETSLTFEVLVVDLLKHYRHQLIDVLLPLDLWKAAQNKQWTDVEFTVKVRVINLLINDRTVNL